MADKFCRWEPKEDEVLVRFFGKRRYSVDLACEALRELPARSVNGIYSRLSELKKQKDPRFAEAPPPIPRWQPHEDRLLEDRLLEEIRKKGGWRCADLADLAASVFEEGIFPDRSFESIRTRLFLVRQRCGILPDSVGGRTCFSDQENRFISNFYIEHDVITEFSDEEILHIMDSDVEGILNNRSLKDIRKQLLILFAPDEDEKPTPLHECQSFIDSLPPLPSETRSSLVRLAHHDLPAARRYLEAIQSPQKKRGRSTGGSRVRRSRHTRELANA
jgi:hypothetical protein